MFDRQRGEERIAGRTARTSEPVDPSALAEFQVKSSSLAIALLGAGLLAIDETHASRGAAWMCVALLALELARLVWRRRHPLLSVHPSSIVIRRDFLRPAQRLSFTELACWGHSERWLGFELLGSKRVYLRLGELRDADRKRLIELLESLNLGRSGCKGLPPRDFRRQDLKAMGLPVAVGVFVIVVLSAMHALGLG